MPCQRSSRKNPESLCEEWVNALRARPARPPARERLPSTPQDGVRFADRPYLEPTKIFAVTRRSHGVIWWVLRGSRSFHGNLGLTKLTELSTCRRRGVGHPISALMAEPGLRAIERFVRGSPAENFAWVHDVFRVQRPLDGAHHVHRTVTCLSPQKVHFVQADAVLPGTGAFER